MYISTVYSGKDKKYKSVLLRTSYREDGKVKHKTIANLSKCDEDEINAIEIALKFKKNIAELKKYKNGVEMSQGKSIGIVAVLNQISKNMFIIANTFFLISI